jgi:glycine oxidase
VAPDVIVIGGGAIGTSITYQLAKRGVRVTLLERSRIGCGATGASAGLLMPRGGPETTPEFVALSHESARLFSALAVELEERTGSDIGYRRAPVLEVAFDETEERQLRAEQARWGGGRWLDPASAFDLEPRLSPAIRGASFSAGDYQVLPLVMSQALARAASDLGADIREATNVDRLQIQGNRVVGVVAGDLAIAAAEVVIASGSWAGAWSHELGLPLPVRPVRGQMASLDFAGTGLRTVVGGAGGYALTKPGGVTLVGTTVEEVGFDARPTVNGIASLLERAPKLVPRLADATVVNAWAGLRPGTPDGLPIIGQPRGWEGVTLATGHFRNGILLAPITGELVADLLQGQTPRLPIARFDPSRFVPHAA